VQMLISAKCILLTYLIFALGLDSFIGGLLVGPVLTRWRDRLGLAALFGVCDGVASLVGGMLPHTFPDIPQALVYGLAVVLVGLAGRRSRSWLLASPLVLALDNLATGAPAAAVPAIAGSSGLLALVGMTASVYLYAAARRLYRRTTASRVDFTRG
jgi:hypothetical protein